MSTVYILELDDKKYYVGSTLQKEFTLDDFDPSILLWTRMHKPIKIMKIFKNCNFYDTDKNTIEMMSKYGINNVRGGSFYETNFSSRKIEILEKLVQKNSDVCIYCGEKNHSDECPQNTIWYRIEQCLSVLFYNITFCFMDNSEYV